MTGLHPRREREILISLGLAALVALAPASGMAGHATPAGPAGEQIAVPLAGKDLPTVEAEVHKAAQEVCKGAGLWRESKSFQAEAACVSEAYRAAMWQVRRRPADRGVFAAGARVPVATVSPLPR